MVTASVCTIGDEILIGQIVDTNSAGIAKELGNIGVKVNYMLSIQDSRSEIISRLKSAVECTDVVIVTGGLGPTKDDVTKDALRELSGSVGYIRSEQQYQIVERILTSRGIEMSDLNRNQALVPDRAEVIPNPVGTAPVMLFRLNDSQGRRKMLFSLPGVPYEAMHALPEVMDRIRREYTLESIVHKNVLVFGIAESVLAKRLDAWEDNLPEDVHLAYLPSPLHGVRLRLSIYGGDCEVSRQRLDGLAGELREMLGNAVYGEDDDTMPVVIDRIFKQNGLTLAFAESCTGGMLSSLITKIPGCSVYYKGSVTSYCNEIKRKVLGVDSAVLEKFGAVSSECVAQMAEGVRALMDSDYAVATSGIAGPGGGSEEKPVGLVWIAVAGRGFVETRSFVFKSDRERNIERFSAHALNFLRECILSGNLLK